LGKIAHFYPFLAIVEWVEIQLFELEKL